MEQRKEIVNRYVSLGVRVNEAVLVAGISKSAYYYKATGGKRGPSPTGYTLKEGLVVSDLIVVQEIENLLSEDYIDYGYHRTTAALQKLGYIINHKKVYRLMKEKGLLYPKIKAGKLAKRGFVEFTVPVYLHPFATLEMDIKQFYVHGEKRKAYLLTLIDTFTRMAVGWVADYRMKHDQVAQLLTTSMNNPHLSSYKEITKVMIRTDNGPQFITTKLADLVKNLPLLQEFIHPGTPQENGHIESFHNTISRLVFKKFNFDTLKQAREELNAFYQVYNNKRIMAEILYCSPSEFLNHWNNEAVEIVEKNNKQKFVFRERQVKKAPALPLQTILGLNKSISKQTQVLTLN